MIIPLAGLLVGALLGVWRAKNRGGTGADLAQWAAVHGILFAILGLFALIVLDRLMA